MKFAIFAVLAISALAWTSVDLDSDVDHPFHGMSQDYWIEHYMMKSSLEEHPEEGWRIEEGNAATHEESFDWRDDASDCVHAIRDQKSCGSCWAFALAEVVTDRYCLATKGEVTNVMSPQFLMNCMGSGQGAYGCAGAMTIQVNDYLADSAVIDTDGCTSYLATDGHSCLSTCDSSSKESFAEYGFSHDDKDSFRMKDIGLIQEAITTNGPIYFSMQVAPDFMNYSGGVFRTVSGGSVGGHAVKAIGWGVDTDSTSSEYAESHYWIVANSWGPRWGEKGYFRIAMTENIAYNAGGPIPKPTIAHLVE